MKLKRTLMCAVVSNDQAGMLLLEQTFGASSSRLRISHSD